MLEGAGENPGQPARDCVRKRSIVQMDMHSYSTSQEVI